MTQSDNEDNGLSVKIEKQLEDGDFLFNDFRDFIKFSFKSQLEGKTEELEDNT